MLLRRIVLHFVGPVHLSNRRGQVSGRRIGSSPRGRTGTAVGGLARARAGGRRRFGGRCRGYANVGPNAGAVDPAEPRTCMHHTSYCFTGDCWWWWWQLLVPKGCPKAANGQSGRVMSRTLPHWDTGITRVSPGSCSLQFVPAPRSYPPGTRTRPRSYSQKKGNYSFATRSWLCSYSFATRTWLCSYSSMGELKRLVLVRGRVRARCGFGNVRVREVPVAVAYPKSNSHMNSNSCAALVRGRATPGTLRAAAGRWFAFGGGSLGAGWLTWAPAAARARLARVTRQVTRE